MRAVVVFVLLALTSAASASESAHFWGTWEPRPMLREFWRPISEKWWSCNNRNECGPDLRLRKRCRDFAGTYSPETAVPELIADLCVYASDANEVVYLYIMSHWPRDTVIRLLDSLRHSPDPCIREITELTREDFLELHPKV